MRTPQFLVTYPTFCDFAACLLWAVAPIYPTIFGTQMP
jgi:hypothetical protein